MTREELTKRVNFPTLSGILRTMLRFSDSHGRDCYAHAALAQAVFKFAGVDANLVIGRAAWRVGEGDGDVVQHVEGEEPGVQGEMCHCWLEVGDLIVDLTTYQLPLKAALLDLSDGGHTEVLWHPTWLIAEKDAVSTYYDVQQLHTGLFFYEEDQELAERIQPYLAVPEGWAKMVVMMYDINTLRMKGAADGQACYTQG